LDGVADPGVLPTHQLNEEDDLQWRLSGLKRSVSTLDHSSVPRTTHFLPSHRQLELTGEHGGLDMTDVDV
jgi:hypothetical protein